MKSELLYPGREFDWKSQAASSDDDLVQDLDLGILFSVMGAGNDVFESIAKRVVLSSQECPDIGIIQYRQAVMKDCLDFPEVVRELHSISADTVENKRRSWFSITNSHSTTMLYSAVELLEIMLDGMIRLRRLASAHGASFQSSGFKRMFLEVERELDEGYLEQVRRHLSALRFESGLLLSGRLEEGDAFVYELRAPPPLVSWWRKLWPRKSAGCRFRLNPRDDAGARALGEIRDRGISAAAEAAAQATEHVLSFFVHLERELSFYIAGINLHEALSSRGAQICFPEVAASGSCRLAFSDLRDAALVLRLGEGVVGNQCNADGRRCVVVTGANRGGKSTFLKSVGIAQVLMHAGLFVAAASYAAEPSARILTHFKREEDSSMERGKFEEELHRMDQLVDRIQPGALLLLNESFASTHEREGAEIARQTISALVESDVRVIFVTHLAEFARRWWEMGRQDSLFLRAQRRADGKRTYFMEVGGPLETSHGMDLFHLIFGN